MCVEHYMHELLYWSNKEATHCPMVSTLSNGKAIYYPLKASIMSNKKATNPPIEKTILLMEKQQMPMSLPLQKDDEGGQLGERQLNFASLKT